MDVALLRAILSAEDDKANATLDKFEARLNALGAKDFKAAQLKVGGELEAGKTAERVRAKVNATQEAGGRDQTRFQKKLEEELERIRVTNQAFTEEKVFRLRVEGETRAQQKIQLIRSSAQARQDAADDKALKAAAERSYRSAQARARIAGGMLTDRASTGATLGGAAVIGAAAFSAKSYVDFDRALRNVNTVAQVTETELQGIGDAVLRLSSDPNIRKGPQDLAGGLYDIYSSGKTGKEALDILKVSALGASAGLTDTKTAAGVLLSVLQSGIGGVNGSQQAMDVLFKTVDRGRLSFGDLASSAGNILPTLAKAGIPLQEYGAYLAVATKQGQSASDATNDLLNLIQKIANPSDEAKKVFDKLGIAYGFSALQGKGLSGVLEDIQKKTGGNADAIAALFKDMQAQRGAMTGLTNAGANLRDELAQQNKAFDGAGAAAKAMAKQNQGAAYEADLLTKDLQNLAIQAGQALAPALRDLVGQTREALQWFNDLDKGTQTNIIKFGLLSGAGLILIGRIKDCVQIVKALKDIHYAAAAAAGTQAIAEQTAAGKTLLSWSGVVGKLRALFRSPITIGIAVGTAGYELGRASGVIDPDEHPNALQAAKNIAARIKGNFTPTTYAPVRPQDNILDRYGLGALRDNNPRDAIQSVLHQQASNTAYTAKHAYGPTTAPPNSANPLAGVESGGHGKSEAERARDKTERDAKAAALRREKDALQDASRGYDLLADSSERSSRRQIEALQNLNDSLQGVFSGLQSDLNNLGVNDALGQKIRALETLLNLGGESRGIAKGANAKISDLRALASQKRGALDVLTGGDGFTPGAHGAALSSRGAAIAGAARDMQTSNEAKAGEFVGHCQRLLRKTVEQVTPEFSRYFAGTAAQTMRNFQHAGIGGTPAKMGYRAGDLAYNGTSHSGDGHAMIVGPDGLFYDQYGAKARPTAAPQWIVRPGGAATSRSAASGAASGVAPATGDPLSGFAGSFSRFAPLPKSWGGMLRQGDKADARQILQEYLRTPEGAALVQRVAGVFARGDVGALADFEKKSGVKYNITANTPTDAAYQLIRQFANALQLEADADNKAAKAGDDLKKSRVEAASAARETLAATLDLTQAERDRRELAAIAHPGAQAFLRGFRGETDSSGAAEIEAKRREIYNGKDLTEMREAADALQKQGKAEEAYKERKKAADAYRTRFADYLDSKRVDDGTAALARLTAEVSGLTDAMQGATDGAGDMWNALFKDARGKLTKDIGAQIGGLSSATEGSGDKWNDLFNKVKARPGELAGVGFDAQRRALEERNYSNSAFLPNQRARAESEIGLRDNLDTWRSQQPGEKPLAADYLEAQKAADQIRLDAASEQDSQSRILNVLAKRRDLEALSATTAAKRLELEFQFIDAARAQLGITLQGKAAEDDAAQRADDRQAAAVEDATKRTMDAAGVMRDSIADGLQNGFSSGVKNWAKYLENMIFQRIATQASNAIFGTDMESANPADMFRRQKKTGGAFGLPSPVIVDSWKPAPEPENKFTAHAMAARGAFGGDGKSLNIHTVNVQDMSTQNSKTQRMDVQRATINQSGGASSGSGGAGSQPSLEQLIGAFGGGSNGGAGDFGAYN